MSSQSYLIDTNVFIGLEDDREVSAEVANVLSLASKHGVGVYVHEAAQDDISRDQNARRRAVSFSKIAKFQTIKRVLGLSETELENQYGELNKPNDVVDATLLHSLDIGAADFLISEDRKLHARARRHAPHLSRRVLFTADAAALLISTYEPIKVPFRYVQEVEANQIPLDDEIFDSLREGYPGFDQWWRKCVAQHRECWAVNDDGLAGLIVRKDETENDTDATLPGKKILKICTFKVRLEKRGTKLGELLLKQALWHAQSNKYDLVYVSTQSDQQALIDLLEYYGFTHTYTRDADGEMFFEKPISTAPLTASSDDDLFDLARLNYPRFHAGDHASAFVIPIREDYHDTLFPELKDDTQGDLLISAGIGSGPKRPGNTIRKVYLSRAPIRNIHRGAVLFFYKGASSLAPSQAITTVGIFEDMQVARSTKDLMQLAGGRSVYSEKQLQNWQACDDNPVKVINFILAGYIAPPVPLKTLKSEAIFSRHPPQSITTLDQQKLGSLLRIADLGFET